MWVLDKMENKKTYTQDDFKKALDELCEKMGWKLMIVPNFFLQDNGTYSLKLEITLVPKIDKK